LQSLIASSPLQHVTPGLGQHSVRLGGISEIPFFIPTKRKGATLRSLPAGHLQGRCRERPRSIQQTTPTC
jgi:hypothetical protein